MTDPAAVARELQKFNKLPGKPILASWMGADEVAEGEAILNAFGIPTFQYPDIAARIFCYMWRSTHNLQALYETPGLTAGPGAHRRRAEEIIQRAREADRTLLTELESKRGPRGLWDTLRRHPYRDNRRCRCENRGEDWPNCCSEAVLCEDHSQN